MYIYADSNASSGLFPNNTPQNFIVELSQTLDTRNCYLGLQELIIDATDDFKYGTADVSKSTFYVLVSECGDSLVGEHSHPVLRMLSLRGIDARRKAVIRFSNVMYLPIKEHLISRLTVRLVRAEDCCSDSPEKLPIQGITRCTFHLKKGY